MALQQAQRQVATFERAKAAAERRLGADLAAEKRQQSELRRQLQQAQVGKRRECAGKFTHACALLVRQQQ